MLEAGTHSKIVQERLGHASISITLDTYSHVAPGLQEAAANHFDELVSTSREKEAVEKFGSGGWIRTNDLRVMSAMSLSP